MQNKRDIIVVIVAILVIVACIVGGYMILNPSKSVPAATEGTINKNSKYVTKDIDEKTYAELKTLSEYTKPALENIGKTDIFAK
jgi:flagellar basal body-associated protein FliL